MTMSSETTHRPTEIIAVASGKGGTGKTPILASLGYSLQRAGHSVLFIDADTATDGLSLFLLGLRGWEHLSRNPNRSVFSTYLRNYKPGSSADLMWREINRGEAGDHGQFYNVIVSGRDLYGEDDTDMLASPDPQIPQVNFRSAVIELFNTFRSSNKWDYVLVDTRGGFGFNSTDICALADSFRIVTEPDFTSFYQNRNLARRIAATAIENNAQAIVRAVIVNKAHVGMVARLEEGDEFATLDMDRVEAEFRNVIVKEFGSLRYQDTYPIPLDLEAVRACQAQRLPFFGGARIAVFVCNYRSV
jgi:MinD-like ATPase involved in chromosome partitioning or flagellar assembly